jgi:hypothetical protein
LSQKQFVDSIVFTQPNLVSFQTATKNLIKNLENLLFLQGCLLSSSKQEIGSVLTFD